MSQTISLHFDGRNYSPFPFPENFEALEKEISQLIKVDVGEFVLEYTHKDTEDDLAFGNNGGYQMAGEMGKHDKYGVIVKVSRKVPTRNVEGTRGPGARESCPVVLADRRTKKRRRRSVHVMSFELESDHSEVPIIETMYWSSDEDRPRVCRVLYGSERRKAIFKWADVYQSRHKHARHLVRNEIRVYSHLQPLQGEFVPRLLAVGCVYGVKYGLVVSECGTTLAKCPSETLRECASGAVTALRRVHKLGVLHGDIRLSNFTVDRGRVFVIDFGFSKVVEGDDTAGLKKMRLEVKELQKLLKESNTSEKLPLSAEL
eukprot:TRINITY_DN2445_c0_g1_i2.p1 TRINITY_DN2445_c0_g1~~TRINITY_DN2445_c0_g1_i2.p1  ORF type:complete len:367 (-),score=43.04 TRINITY_DN2445_c0_g1_i2:1439-2386(-)